MARVDSTPEKQGLWTPRVDFPETPPGQSPLVFFTPTPLHHQVRQSPEKHWESDEDSEEPLPIMRSRQPSIREGSDSEEAEVMSGMLREDTLDSPNAFMNNISDQLFWSDNDFSFGGDEDDDNDDDTGLIGPQEYEGGEEEDQSTVETEPQDTMLTLTSLQETIIQEALVRAGRGLNRKAYNTLATVFLPTMDCQSIDDLVHCSLRTFVDEDGRSKYPTRTNVPTADREHVFPMAIKALTDQCDWANFVREASNPLSRSTSRWLNTARKNITSRLQSFKAGHQSGSVTRAEHAGNLRKRK